MPLFGRRSDLRRPSPLCSTGTITVFVALFIVGVLTMKSSYVFPAALPAENKSEAAAKRIDADAETDQSLDATNTVKQGGQDLSLNGGGGDGTDAERKDEVEVKGTADNASQKPNEKPQDEDGVDAGKQDAVSGRDSGDSDSEKPVVAPDEDSSSNTTTAGSNAALMDTGDRDEDAAGNGTRPTLDDAWRNDGPDGHGDIDNRNATAASKVVSFEDENGMAAVTGEDSGGMGNDTSSNEQSLADNGNGGNNIDNITSPEDVSAPVNGETRMDEKQDDRSHTADVAAEVFPNGRAELLNETTAQNGTFATQIVESKNERDATGEAGGGSDSPPPVTTAPPEKREVEHTWVLCNTTAGADYIPCLDNEEAIKKLPSTMHYEHRERHCPEQPPTCLVPLPDGYKKPLRWPDSRDKVWYNNVPHTGLVGFKGHQNWVKASGEFLKFPGGGTQFMHGALHYVDNIQENFPAIAWGKKTRVVLDVGCGVASLGGYLFERDVLTMSFAPKDEHEAQVQFALERGIPALSAVMGTKRLPFPGGVFDAIHCARCRVPWHAEGGRLLLELDRLLRPGGYFVWSATPVYRKGSADTQIWNDMSALTKSMCWELVKKMKDSVDKVSVAIYKKPSSNACYDGRPNNEPPMCEQSDDPNAAWNVTIQACLHRLPSDMSLRGSQWPEQWPGRLEKVPYCMNSSQVGVFGKPAPQDFDADYAHWRRVMNNSYLTGMGIDWSDIRNVMDMRAVYGSFAAALHDMKVWVMNVVPVDSADTLPIIYERGLFGIYHDWCESFSTYPRSYDLLHADHLFSRIKDRCNLVAVMAEVDRMLRPAGKLIVRDDAGTVGQVVSIVRSLRWEVRMTLSSEKEGLLAVVKSIWRPTEVE